MYTKVKNVFDETAPSLMVKRLFDNAFIPFYSANTDFQKFKTDVLEGAELQDADGNVMSAEDAIAFVATLP